MSREVNVSLIQMSMGKDPVANLEKAKEMIRQAALKGANIVCLPELFTSPYFPQEQKTINAKYYEKIPGQTTHALSEAAADNNVVVVGGSIFEKSGKNFFNTSVIFDEKGKLLGKYRKMHVPHDEKFYEKNYFSPGNQGYKVFKTNYGKIGVLICYDQWFPEASRINALMGADIIFYPTAIGWVKGIEPVEGNWQEAWEAVQRGHAIVNGVIVAATNRVGNEGDMQFWGGSFIYNAFGKLLAKGSVREEIVLARCDLDHGNNIKEGWKFFHNRRPETYKRLINK